MPRVTIYLPKEHAERLEQLRRLWMERAGEPFPLSARVQDMIEDEPNPPAKGKAK